MQPYQYVMHHADMSLGTPLTYSYYKNMEQSWPSVPRAGDQVEVGHGQVSPVQWVEFQDEKIRLHFHAEDQDFSADDLALAGFARPA